MLIWRDEVSKKWGHKFLDKIAPLSCLKGSKEWDRWMSAANVLLSVGLSPEQIELHVLESVRACHSKGDLAPPPPNFFTSPKSWKMRVLVADDARIASMSDAFKALITQDIEAKVKREIARTCTIGRIAWKAVSKLEPDSEKARWSKLLHPTAGILITALSGGVLSDHFTAFSTSSAYAFTMGIKMPWESHTALERIKAEVIESKQIAKMLSDSFQDELDPIINRLASDQEI